MEVRFVTRNVELPGDIKDYMEKKLFKIEKFFDRILDTQVAVSYTHLDVYKRQILTVLW